MLQKRLSALCAFIAIAVAACGGANTTGQYPNVPVNAGTQGTYQVTGPSNSQITLSIGASAATTGGAKPVLTVAASANAPANTTTLQSVAHRTTQARVSTLSTGDSALFYLTVSSNVAANVATINGLGAQLGSAPSSAPYLAYYNGTQWVTLPQGAGSAATVTGSTISFGSLSMPQGYQIPAGGTLDLVVYTGVTLTTPTPPPVPVASPAAQTLYVGTTGTATITSGPNTALTAVSSKTSVATVTATGNTGSGTTASFTVTAVAVGTTTLTFTDSANHSTTEAITVVNSPFANPATVTLGLGDSVNVVVADAPNVSISAASSANSVATVNTPVTTDSDGHATFTVTPVAGGVTTVTFTDSSSKSATMNVTVSAVKGGTFDNSAAVADWAPCSYAHTKLTGPINESTPPAPASSPQTSNTSPVPAASLIPMAVGAPPVNYNPNALGTAPPVLGSSVAIIGTLNAATNSLPKGESGICQTINVPANGPNTAQELSFWVYEGGNEYNFKYDNQDAVILNSSGTTVLQTLFAEQHCFAYPNPVGWAPGVTTGNGCWPSAYGGDTGDYMDWVAGGFWSPRGPYSLQAYAGQSVTLYFGQWSAFDNPSGTPANDAYAAFMFLGNVQMTGSTSFPTTAPLLAHHTYSMALQARH